MNSIYDKIITYLKKPYPYYYKPIGSMLQVLSIAFVLSFTFSYFFEPFEVNRTEHRFDYFWICIIHAFLPIIIAFIYLSILNFSIKNDLKWTLGREAIHLTILLIFFGFGSFLIRDIIYDKPDNWELHYLIEEITNTLLVGLLLVFILLPLNLLRLQHKYQTSALNLGKHTPEKSKTDETLEIQSLIPSENFTIEVSNFIFAKVDGNYIDIYTKTSNGIEKKMLRQSLKNLENQLKPFPIIFQTHRSFLVNLSFIESVAGNAQGFLIALSNCDIKVPVSRSKIEEFRQLFSKNN